MGVWEFDLRPYLVIQRVTHPVFCWKLLRLQVNSSARGARTTVDSPRAFTNDDAAAS